MDSNLCNDCQRTVGKVSMNLKKCKKIKVCEINFEIEKKTSISFLISLLFRNFMIDTCWIKKFDNIRSRDKYSIPLAILTT